MDQITQEASERGKQEWLERVKREFQNGPLASNAVFGFILMILERLVETEFECPCKETGNGGFVAAFFIFPGILAFVLMASVQELKCSDKDDVKRFVYCLVPSFVWMILLVFDGRYIACAMTSWKGRYVTADKAAPLKWCEPENGTSYQKNLEKSQDWYFYSQWAGLGLVLVLALALALVPIIKCTMNQQSPSTGSTKKAQSGQRPSYPTPCGQGEQTAAADHVNARRQTNQASCSASDAELQTLHTNTPSTNPTDN